MDGGVKDDSSLGQVDSGFRQPSILEGERLINRGAFHTRIESPAFPGKIIRRMGPFNREEGVNEKLDVSTGLFAELSSDYGINVPGFSTRVFKDPEGGFCGDIVVDQVKGVPLVEAIKSGEPDITVEDLDRLGEKLATYYIDKKKNGGDVLYDLRVDQFMWGEVEGDQTKKAYYVDLDPMHDDAVSVGRISLLWQSVLESEKDLSSKLALSRIKLLELIEEFRYLEGSMPAQAEEVQKQILSTS